MPPCSCQSSSSGGQILEPAKPRTSFRTAATFGPSFVVALVSKGPVCWASYSSALGIGSIVHIQYLRFMFPVLVAMLGIGIKLALIQFGVEIQTILNQMLRLTQHWLQKVNLVTNIQKAAKKQIDSRSLLRLSLVMPAATSWMRGAQ